MAAVMLTTQTRTLMDLIVRPSAFFADRFGGISAWQATGTLVFAALFSGCCLALLGIRHAPLVTGAIGVINGISMAAVGCGVGCLATALIIGAPVPLARMWAVYALSSGAVLLIAWVPSAFLFTEPWRWTLIGIGMVRGLHIRTNRAVLIVLLTFGATVLMVYAGLALVQGMVGRH